VSVAEREYWLVTMSRNQVSHRKVALPVLNPFHRMGKVLAEASTGELARMAKETRTLAYDLKTTPRCLDVNELVRRAKASGLYDRLAKVVRATVAEEPPLGKVPLEAFVARPPPATHLYSRVEKGADVLDVGSGDGKRLISYRKEFDLKTVDPSVEKTRIKAPHQQELYVNGHEGVCTFFNSMTNTNEPGIVDNDGLAVGPNIELWEQAGLARRENGAYVSEVMGKKYVDHPWQIPVEALPSNPQYVHGNLYRRRVVDLVSDGKQARGPQMPSSGRRGICVNGIRSASFKYDGELVELRTRNGTTMLRDRSGLARSLSGKMPDSVVLLERMKDKYVLVRVSRYRGFVPYHGLSLLHYFVERVKITIDGLPVKAPDPFDWDEYDRGFAEGIYDGMVVREGETDILIRENQSFDVLHSSIPLLVSALAESGISCTGELEAYEGLGEVEVARAKNRRHATLLFKRLRRDKDKEDNLSQEAVEERMMWTVVYDLRAENYDHRNGSVPMNGSKKIDSL
jgi:hypothetical protein